MLAVVVVNFNDTMASIRALRSAASADPVMLILVDNCSDEDPTAAVTASCPDAVVERLAENSGYAAACNHGVQVGAARGADRVLVMNNDAELTAGALDRLTAADREHPGCILAPLIVYADAPNEVWSAGGYLEPPCVRNHHLGLGEPRAAYASARPVEWATGCALYFSIATFVRVGPFDEAFFLYLEDVDWCLRARRVGITTWIIPEAIVRHDVSRTTAGLPSETIRYYAYRNHFRLAFRHAFGWERGAVAAERLDAGQDRRAQRRVSGVSSRHLVPRAHACHSRLLARPLGPGPGAHVTSAILIPRRRASVRPAVLRVLGVLGVIAGINALGAVFGVLMVMGVAAVLTWRFPAWAAVALIALVPVNRFLILLVFHFGHSRSITTLTQLWKDLLIAVLFARALDEIIVRRRPKLHYVDVMVIAFMAISVLYLFYPGNTGRDNIMDRLLGFRRGQLLHARLLRRPLHRVRETPRAVAAAVAVAGNRARRSDRRRPVRRTQLVQPSVRKAQLLSVHQRPRRIRRGRRDSQPRYLGCEPTARELAASRRPGTCVLLDPRRRGRGSDPVECPVGTCSCRSVRCHGPRDRVDRLHDHTQCRARAAVMLIVMTLFTRRPRRTGAVALALAMAAMVALVSGAVPLRAIDALSNPHEASIQAHGSAVSQGLQIVDQEPLGLGLGTVGTIGQRAFGADAVTTENWYLQIAAEMGLVPGLLFVALSVAVAVEAYRSFRRVRDLALMRVCLAVAGGSVGFLILGNMLHAWEVLVVSMAFWLLAGIAVGARETDADPDYARSS